MTFSSSGSAAVVTLWGLLQLAPLFILAAAVAEGNTYLRMLLPVRKRVRLAEGSCGDVEQTDMSSPIEV